MFLLKKYISYIYIYIKSSGKKQDLFIILFKIMKKSKKKKNEGNWFDKKPFFFKIERLRRLKRS
jgi:hypothetical protein